MSKEVWVYGEIRNGELKRVSLELLTVGKQLATQLKTEISAVVMGYQIGNIGESFSNHGPLKVLSVENEKLKDYDSDIYTSTLRTMIDMYKPGCLLFPATCLGNDLASRLATRLGKSLETNCTGIKVSDGAFETVKPIYGGKFFRHYLYAQDEPNIVTIRPKSFEVSVPTGIEPHSKRVDVDLSEGEIKTKVVERYVAKGGDITEAEVIVAGGRGMGGGENFSILENLTEILPGAVVGASRSAVDAGWMAFDKQVGLT
ncbi:MAG: electron transfer flavoprotein subunit alpha/FixB family protein, partial [Deltaproteobacteria bacterium]